MKIGTDNCKKKLSSTCNFHFCIWMGLVCFCILIFCGSDGLHWFKLSRVVSCELQPIRFHLHYGMASNHLASSRLFYYPIYAIIIMHATVDRFLLIIYVFVWATSMPLPPRTYASLTWQPVARCIYENAFEFSQCLHAIVLTMGKPMLGNLSFVSTSSTSFVRSARKKPK